MKRIAVCLDYSGSMGSRLKGGEPGIENYCMLDLAILLLLSLVNGLPDGTVLSVIGFSSSLLRLLPPTEISESTRRDVFDKVKNFGLKPQGLTAMWEVLQKAVREFPNEPDGDNTVLLLTDGNPTTAVPSGGLAQGLGAFVQSKMPHLNFTLHSFGLGRDVDSRMLDDLTQAFDGANIFVSDPGMAAAAFSARCTNMICPRSKEPSPALREFSAIYVRAISRILEVLNTGLPTRSYYSPQSTGDAGIAECGQVFDRFKGEIATWLGGDDIDPAKLIDYTDQIRQACSRRDWASDWGIHYLRSMLSAHSRFEVVSALDSALQEYIPLYPQDWEDCLLRLDDCFMEIEPPAPCMPATGHRSSCGASVSITPIHVQQVVASQGCFHPDTLVTLADGKQLPCKELTKGVDVLTHDNVRDTILVVVRSQAEELYQLPHGGPRVTAWHPVLWEQKWCFPAEISGATRIPYSGEVYSFLLATRGASLLFDRVPGVALAHRLSGLPQHHFWGTEEVVREMIRVQPDALETGQFDMRRVSFMRNSYTGRVCGFSPLSTL